MEWAETLKLLVEVVIGAVTAFGTVYVTLRQSRGDVQKSVSNSFQTMLKDMEMERDELVELISKSHRENLALQKEIASLHETLSARPSR